MKKRFLALLCVAPLLLATGCSSPAPATPNELTLRMADTANRTITVTGKAGVNASPDIATIVLGVETRGTSSEDARVKSNTAINATVAAVKELGVAEADIISSNLSLWPRTNDNGVVTGYQMNIDLSIVVRDITKAGAVVDAAIASGSNSLSQIRYSLSKEEELYQEALTNAITTARKKADLLAAASGKTITEVLTIAESTKGPVLRANPDTGGGAKASANVSTDLMVGTSTINAEATVTFLMG